MSTTPSYISSMFAKVASTAQESPVIPLPGQEDQSVRLAASAEVGQVEGTTRVSLKDFGDRLTDLLCFLPSGRLAEDQFNETLQGMNCDLLIIQTRSFLKSAIATLAKIRSDSEHRS